MSSQFSHLETRSTPNAPTRLLAFLNAQTVLDDDEVDSLFGYAGIDWFFPSNGDPTPDFAKNERKN